MKIRIIPLIAAFVCCFTLNVSAASEVPKMYHDVIDIFHPVGSCYETSDGSFNPNATWGGTWTLETEGNVTVSAGTGYAVNSTGGTTDEVIPTHSHSIPSQSTGSSGGGDMSHMSSYVKKVKTGSKKNRISGGGSGTETNWTGDHGHSFSAGATNTNGTNDSTTGSTLEAADNGNMQPYINVYRWRRTG